MAVAWSFIDQSLRVELVEGLNAMKMIEGVDWDVRTVGEQQLRIKENFKGSRK
jgi:hypothetical protein